MKEQEHDPDIFIEHVCLAERIVVIEVVNAYVALIQYVAKHLPAHVVNITDFLPLY